MKKWFLVIGIVTLLHLFILSTLRAEEESEKIYEIGGQVRVRFDATNYQYLEDLSYTPSHRETQVLERTRVHVKLEPYEWIRAYIEPQWYGHQGGFDNKPQLSLYQGYLEFPRFAGIPVDIKVGRQDFCYGSAFFLGNDDFYQGLTWDGVKIHVKPNTVYMLDMIAAQIVSFNDNNSHTFGIYGFYGTYKGIKDTDLDLYFFFNRKGFKHMYGHIHGSPLWFTLGTRYAGRIFERIYFEVEPMYQFGRVRNDARGGDDQIRAYGGHVDAGYDFNLPGEPNLTLSYAFGTGDSNNKDNTMREFLGNVYNDTLLVGDMSMVPDVSGIEIDNVRASGIKVLTVMTSVKPHPSVCLNLDYHYFVAQHVPKGFTRTIGSEVDFFVSYDISENVNILVSANRFFTNDIFREATGRKKNVDYFYLQTQVEF